MKNTTKYPKKITISYYPENANVNNTFLKLYDCVYIVNSQKEEIKIYEGLNHQANLTIIEG